MYEVTRWDPGSGFTWRASTPGVRTTATHRLETQGETTRLLLGIEWSGPLAGVVGLLMRSKTERMVGQEADTFATLAESGAQPA
jgi:hypothetical protein